LATPTPIVRTWPSSRSEGEAIHVEGFSLVAYDIFWVHENLRWLQARMLDATQGIRAEMQEELAG